jgi:hypothetical protein
LVVFPAYDDCPSKAQLKPLSRGQAVLRLLESSISLGTTLESGLEIVASVMQMADAYSLCYHDPREALDLILEMAPPPTDLVSQAVG